MRIGVIGYGAIGRDVVERIERSQLQNLTLASIFSRTASASTPLLTTDFSKFLASKPELVIEAAGQAAVHAYAPKLVQSGISLAICSVGAFADEEFEVKLCEYALNHNVKIYFPACAIGGLDRIASANEGHLETVKLTTKKPPASWYGTDVEEQIDLEYVPESVRVFAGTAREAARKYPQNANVSAALGLAGVGLDRTEVEVWVDPDIDQNVHSVKVQGDSGLFSFDIKNSPSDNPKTGVIVAMSILKLLRNLHSPFVIGI